MSQSHHELIKNKKWFSGLLMGIFLTLYSIPSNAFIPYFYEPNRQELKDVGISIGKTAAQLIQLGQTKEAGRLAILAVKIAPNDHRLWAILAEAQIRNNEFKQASLSLSKAKQLNPSNASLWFAEGSLWLQQRKPYNAIQSINQGLKLQPNNAGAYFQLGNAQIMQTKLRPALQAFKKAIKIKPNFWEALNNQGLVLFEMGETNSAIKTWRKVLNIKQNAEPMLALAAALNQIDSNNQEVIKLANNALNQNPKYVLGEYQKEQLWGIKLQKATKLLFTKIQLKAAVEQALANTNKD